MHTYVTASGRVVDLDVCERCEGPNPVWHTENGYWDEAMEAAGRSPESVLCPRCFLELVDFGDEMMYVGPTYRVQMICREERCVMISTTAPPGSDVPRVGAHVHYAEDETLEAATEFVGKALLNELAERTQDQLAK